MHLKQAQHPMPLRATHLLSVLGSSTDFLPSQVFKMNEITALLAQLVNTTNATSYC